MPSLGFKTTTESINNQELSELQNLDKDLAQKIFKKTIDRIKVFDKIQPSEIPYGQEQSIVNADTDSKILISSLQNITGNIDAFLATKFGQRGGLIGIQTDYLRALMNIYNVLLQYNNIANLLKNPNLSTREKSIIKNTITSIDANLQSALYGYERIIKEFAHKLPNEAGSQHYLNYIGRIASAYAVLNAINEQIRTSQFNPINYDSVQSGLSDFLKKSFPSQADQNILKQALARSSDTQISKDKNDFIKKKQNELKTGLLTEQEYGLLVKNYFGADDEYDPALDAKAIDLLKKNKEIVKRQELKKKEKEEENEEEKRRKEEEKEEKKRRKEEEKEEKEREKEEKEREKGEKKKDPKFKKSVNEIIKGFRDAGGITPPEGDEATNEYLKATAQLKREGDVMHEMYEKYGFIQPMKTRQREDKGDDDDIMPPPPPAEGSGRVRRMIMPKKGTFIMDNDYY
jgi:hypothetical protein